jgi:hypothetical protein
MAQGRDEVGLHPRLVGEEGRVDLALSKPDIGPVSKPSARAAMMK